MPHLDGCPPETAFDLQSLYGEHYDYEPTPSGPRKKLMLATIPRSGSNFLCLEMWRTGVMGAPMEYLNLKNRFQDMIERLGNGDVKYYWTNIQRVRTSSNGIFSFKAFTRDFEQLAAVWKSFEYSVTADAVIYLTRRNKLLQAVSYYRAYQTNVWYKGAEDKNKPVYSREGIDGALSWISQSEYQWEKIFEEKKYNPLRLYYEDIIDDVTGTILSCLELCDEKFSPDACVELPVMAIQRDTQSESWVDRYNAGL